MVLLIVSTAGLVVFLYGVSFALFPFYAGASPIFILATGLFYAAVLLPIQAGLNARVFTTWLLLVALNMALFYVGREDVETSRSTLFVGGVPTAEGLIFQLTIWLAILMFATGLSLIIRQFSDRIRHGGQRGNGPAA